MRLTVNTHIRNLIYTTWKGLKFCDYVLTALYSVLGRWEWHLACKRNRVLKCWWFYWSSEFACHHCYHCHMFCHNKMLHCSTFWYQPIVVVLVAGSVIFVTKIKTRTRIIGRRFQRTRTRIIVIQKTKTK